MDGFSRCPDHCSRKSHWPRKAVSGWLAVQRGVSASNSQKTSTAGRENPRTRLAMGVDEVKRRRKELNSMRSDFNAYRWRARTEWADKKILFSNGREFCSVNTAAAHFEARRQDPRADMRNFGGMRSQCPNKPQIGIGSWTVRKSVPRYFR